MGQLNQAFSTPAGRTRREILVHLDRGKANVSKIIRRFDLTQPTISAHRKMLETEG